MEVVFCQAGSQLHDNAILADLLLLLYPADQIAQFSLHRPAAATATGEIERAICLVFGVSGKAACAFTECPFAIIAGAAFRDYVALDDDYIVLVVQIYHIPSFK